ncbi:hypothetical protein BAUCODRAFT_521363 [Baudoinia panamericana UAMH 10762]|uniref:Zn(2)-C6 fungal-type domain-containing protein n=1 Tax=Baudoinia panamericana (strain UAMH 10762) TaxID=717646 RepID=M2N7H0_BAUPA|nr:uncharacterized protein BAUCODRAFT_521363 [Baudoinia panamericana UAMH 10762]EMC94999.1 hypothetical protein BAUCODRAFT_521363 [Baudoinia panamericana UAMH 10762]
MEPTMLAPLPSGHTKQYVFVDEYNRHKRLKVMRACDGCRKRKIRCDGALQNGPWPCGACVRLKLKCVPPTQDSDDEQQPVTTPSGPGNFTFQTTTLGSNNSPTSIDGYPTPSSQSQDWVTSAAALQPTLATTAPPYSIDSGSYSSYPFDQPLGLRVDPAYGLADSDCYTSVPDLSQFRPTPSLLRSHTDASSVSSGDPHEVDATVKELSGQMGDLTIETTSVAPWVANERRILAETPAVEEAEVALPPSVGTDSTVRIPPEMMPTDERAMEYFGYFFTFIHPYIPVLNKRAFYEQWQTARHSISPLLLEGIFACVARYLEEPYDVRRWLALAARHEESFKDVPRLSTIQALLMLMKAREFVPRRGYYYRSWMAVKYMTTMAFDLGLHEHRDQHRFGSACSLKKADCMVRTRIWQTLFSLENLVGAPQGRTDFSIEVDTVESEVLPPDANIDPFEYQASRRCNILVQNVRNIKYSNNLYHNMRRYKKDWALDPAFIRHNDELFVWLKQLPADLQMQYPDDESPPWLHGDHFVAYLHIYHNLVVIMQHRPQVQALLEKRDPAFKTELEICLQSAVLLCRLQEALIREFGLHGLQLMQRGTNFTIYCVLTCAMLHLAAITSPDPALYEQARMYFPRHMRILEQCIPSASSDMQAQINALREAFSQDTSKPFELKPSLALRSPGAEERRTSPELRQAQAVHHSASWPQLQDSAHSNTASPTSDYMRPFEHIPGRGVTSQPANPAMNFMTGGYQVPTDAAFTAPQQQVTSAPQTGYALEPVVSNEQPASAVWDPSGIFQQWNTAFGAPAQTSPQAAHLINPRMSPTSNGPTHYPAPTSHPAAMYPANPLSSSMAGALPDSPTISSVPTVTPVMWQDAFTTAYVSGQGNKRYRQEDRMLYDQYAKRRS